MMNTHKRDGAPHPFDWGFLITRNLASAQVEHYILAVPYLSNGS